jgi:hypothetical protein
MDAELPKELKKFKNTDFSRFSGKKVKNWLKKAILPIDISYKIYYRS